MRSYIDSTKAASYDTLSILRKRNSFLHNSDNTSITKTAIPSPIIIPDPFIINSTTNYLGIYAFYQKVSVYSGPHFKLRRSSDSAELDFYGTGSVAAWLGVATGYVITWYDQSGNGKHFTENTAMPTITLADSSIGNQTSMDLATGRGMSSSLNPGASGNVAFVVGYIAYTGGNRVLAGSNNWLMGPYSGLYNLYESGFTGGASVSTNIAKIHTGYRFSNSGWTARLNGSANGSVVSGGQPGNVGLGIRGAFGESAGSRIFELLVYDNLPNLAYLTTLETLTNSRYSLY